MVRTCIIVQLLDAFTVKSNEKSSRHRLIMDYIKFILFLNDIIYYFYIVGCNTPICTQQKDLHVGVVCYKS